jgi:acetamidase/formamidase
VNTWIVADGHVHAGVRTVHDVAPDAIGYAWDNSAQPALEIESGDVVDLHVREASDGQIGRDATAADVAAIDFSHVNPVCGPIWVKGARPGDVLAVELLEFRPGSWGWTAIIPGFGLLADEFPEPWLRVSQLDGSAGVIRFSDRISLPLRPFPGTVGVAPAEAGTHPILPPTRWGGNMDTRHLQAGTTLYLPIGVEGAMFSLGDTHATQGDGEVCGTAVEAAMDVTVRLSLRRDLSVDAPQLGVPAGGGPDAVPGGWHVCTGIGPDLMEAAREAVRASIEHMRSRHGLDREEAYAVASVACDLRIHEVVDAPNWVVGAFIPQGIFEPAG